jgi:hypothetical protein
MIPCNVTNFEAYVGLPPLHPELLVSHWIRYCSDRSAVRFEAKPFLIRALSNMLTVAKAQHALHSPCFFTGVIIPIFRQSKPVEMIVEVDNVWVVDVEV